LTLVGVIKLLSLGYDSTTKNEITWGSMWSKGVTLVLVTTSFYQLWYIIFGLKIDFDKFKYGEIGIGTENKLKANVRT